MKRTKFTEHQIVKILKEAEAGVSVPDLCRQYSFSKSSYYKWKAKYGGILDDRQWLEIAFHAHQKTQRSFAYCPNMLLDFFSQVPIEKTSSLKF